MNIVLATAPHSDSPWNRESFPPLGLLYVAGGIRNLVGVSVRVVDAYGESLDVEQAADRLLSLSPDIIGLTITSRNVEDAQQLIAACKAARPQAVIVAGGIHPTLFDRLLLREIPELDFCIRGEGEESFAALCANLLEGKDVAGLPGLSYRSHGGIVRGQPQQVEDLDSLPFPDRALLTHQDYGRQWYGYELPDLPRMTTAFSSRGCPYHCTFCADTRICGGKLRVRSAENVFEELAVLSRQGYKFVIFFDDNLVFDVPRLNKLCQLILESKLDMRFACAGTLHMLPQSTLDRMHEAGFDAFFVGVESGSDSQLKRYRKPASRKGMAAGITRAKKAHMAVIASFINGAPRETERDFQETLEFIKEVKPTVANIGPLMVHPGSYLWEELNGAEEPGNLAHSFSRPIWRYPNQVDTNTVRRRARAFREAFGRTFFSWCKVLEFLDLLRHNPSWRNAIQAVLRKHSIVLAFLPGRPRP
jgi:anaerobic magnesium-protoporphyrin IX monomethyl ester cyclase